MKLNVFPSNLLQVLMPLLFSVTLSLAFFFFNISSNILSPFLTPTYLIHASELSLIALLAFSGSPMISLRNSIN